MKKAKDAGFATCDSLMMVMRKDLLNVKGLSEGKVEKMLEGARKLCRGCSFITGAELMEKRKECVYVTTGCQAFDEILGGGIQTSSITECYGEFRTGKTQLVHTLAVTTQMPTEMGGGNGKVAIIDSEGTFRPSRLVPIAQRFGLDPEAVLENVLHARPYTSEHQHLLIMALAAKMVEEPFKLIVVDSITALFRTDYSGRGELAERQQRLMGTLSKLTKLAEEFNCAVFLTNQVIADPGGGAMFVQDPKKPAGGHVLAHMCTTRLFFRKGKAEQRLVKIIDSPDRAEAEASFAITEGGVNEYSG